MSEGEIQANIVEYLRVMGAIVIRQNAGRGRQNQRLAPAGTPDLLAALPGGRTAWIEVKTKAGQLRPAQVEMHQRLTDMGHAVVVARSVDDVSRFLQSSG